MEDNSQSTSGRTAVPPAGKMDEELFKSLVLPSEEMLKHLDEKAPDHSLLGTLLWRGSVVLLAAQTSAGKTILAHRLGRNLAAGEPFLGMTPDRPLRVLHIDLESPQGAKEMILEAIPPVPGWDLTYPYISSTQAKWLVTLGMHDLVIVDNLQTVYPTKDENDNSQATEQMNFFAKGAKITGSCILVLHNTGKSDHVQEVWRARGASARLDRADIAINLTEGKDDDWVLKVVKSRFGNIGETIRYKWAENYDYTVVKHDKIATGMQRRMELDILDAVPEGQEVKRERIAAQLEIVPGTSKERLFNRALESLLSQRKLFKPGRYGYYQKGSPSGETESPASPESNQTLVCPAQI